MSASRLCVWSAYTGDKVEFDAFDFVAGDKAERVEFDFVATRHFIVRFVVDVSNVRQQLCTCANTMYWALGGGISVDCDSTSNDSRTAVEWESNVCRVVVVNTVVRNSAHL